MKKLVAFILIMMMFTLTACGSKEADTNEVSGVSAEEEAAKAAEEEAKAKAAAEAKENEVEEPEVDSDALVAGFLAELPELPVKEYTYEEDWSDRLNRVTHYIINFDGKVKYDDVMAYLTLLETEYGYMSEGKEEWNEEDGTTTFGYTGPDGQRIDIIITEPEGDDWMVDVSIRIYV